MAGVDSKVLIEFGEAVNRERTLRGWTLDRLATEMKSGHKSYLSNIEKGRRATITRRTVGRLIQALNLDPGWIDRFPSGNEADTDDPTPAENAVEALVDRAQADETAPKTPEDFLIELAAEFIGSKYADAQLAYNDLRAALEAAAALERRAEMPSNLGDQVQATLKEVNRLKNERQFEAAQARLRTEIDRIGGEVAERQAAQAELHETGIDLARVANDPDAAAAHVLARLALDMPLDPFSALRAEQEHWYVAGRDKGRAFDLEVSIALAQACIDRASDTDERGAALNDLGNFLATLGAREPSSDRLEEATDVLQNALESRNRDSAPLKWARTQMNIGIVLRTLGVRELGTDRLKDSIDVFRDALEERPRDRVPLDWAVTQMNLGNALSSLGEREPGTERFRQAVGAFREALKELPRDSVPLTWAKTQMNLGAALTKLGERETGTDHLEEAIAAFHEALKEQSRDHVPLDWASTQANLGAALSVLGSRESDKDRLEQAVGALYAALEEFARERVPLSWASAQYNIGWVLVCLGKREPGIARLEEAIAASCAALEVYTRDHVPFDWGFTQCNIADAELALCRKKPDAALLARARDRVMAAREVISEGAPQYLEWADNLLAEIDAAGKV